MNPDCRDGKHTACRGDAWDLERDEESRCSCICHDIAGELHEHEVSAGWLCTTCAATYASLSRRTLYRRRAAIATRAVKGVMHWSLADLAQLERAT